MNQNQWEQHYLEALIDHLEPKGDVLQVGFSSSYAADRIQTYHPKSHIIIEPDLENAAKARKWAKGNPAITILADRWEHALPKLGSFDAVFFDDFNPELEKEKVKQLASVQHAVQKGKELVSSVKSKMPEITRIKYSDKDLDQFFNSFAQVSPAKIVRFLEELRRNEQISQAQYEERMRPFEGVASQASKSPDQLRMPDTMMPFLKSCLKSHMRKGSRFTCFANSPLSKFENAEFFEEIITNPNYDYEEKIISVDVPPSCEYYKFKEALILMVVKQVE